MRLRTQRVRRSSNNAAVVTVSQDVTGPVVVANSSTVVGDNKETATKLTSGTDNGANSLCLCISGSGAPTHCEDDAYAAAFRCPQDYEVDETETVVCLPTSVDPQRPTSAVGNSDVRDGVVECRRPEVVDEDEDEAWTTTSGSYSAGDLCDEIDQLFFAQSRDTSLLSS